MHRVDTSGATQDNKFTDGNPATSTPATVVDAAILNALVDEIVYCIETAGIALVKGTNTQLWAALLAKFATIVALDTHAALTNPHSATSAATAERLVMRDATGRAKFAEGVATGDAVVFSQFALGNSQNGYQKLPSGVILQWGAIDSGAGGVADVTFPVAFPNSCWGVYANHEGGDGAMVTIVGGFRSIIGCRLQIVNHAGSTSAGWSMLWFAIGR